MINRLKKTIINEQFNPKIIGLFINPFYFARKGLYCNISKLIKNLHGKILDIGCGSKPYENLCTCDEYIGLELDSEQNRKYSKADSFYDGYKIPFRDNSFDSILSNQVFEHVFNPDTFLKEVNRVIRDRGLLLLTIPFVWDEHEQPHDYARYSSFGIRYILQENGFEIIEQKKINNGIEVIFQLTNAYLFKITMSNNRYINLLLTLVLIAPVNILGLVLSHIMPKNDDLYLDNIILAKKVRNV